MANPFVAIPSGGLKTDEAVLLTRGLVMQGPWAGLQLSEATKKFWTSGMTPDFPGERTFKSLNVAELECPTAGVGSTVVNSYTFTTVGPPWLPFIVPPAQVTTLQPIWSILCAGNTPNNMIGVFDPPHVLMAAPSRLVPDGFVHNKASPTPAVALPANQPKAQAGPKLIAPGPTPLPDAKTGAISPKIKDTPKTPDLRNGPTGSKQPHENEQHREFTDPGGRKPQSVPGDSRNSHPDPFVPHHPSQNGPGNDLEDFVGDKPLSNTIMDGVATAIHSAGKDIVNGPHKPDQDAPISPIIVGSHTFKPAASGFTIDGKAVKPGGPAITTGHKPISLSPLGILHVGSQKISLPSANRDEGAFNNPPPSLMTVGSHTFTPDKSGFSIGSKTVKPGGPAVTIAHTPISLGPSGVLHVGGKTVSLSSPSKDKETFNNPPASPMTVGGHCFKPAASGFSVDGTPVKPGGPAVTIAHTPISLDRSGTLQIGGDSIPLGPSNTESHDPTPASPTTVGDQTFTPAVSGFPVDGTPIRPGGPAVTINHARLSLGSSGILVVGSQTTSLSPSDSEMLIPTPNLTPTPLVFTLGHQTITPAPAGFVFAGKTVRPGGVAVHYSGTKVSLGSSGELVIGSKTISLSLSGGAGGGGETPAPNNATQSGSNLSMSGSNGPGTEAFTGNSPRHSASKGIMVAFTILCCLVHLS